MTKPMDAANIRPDAGINIVVALACEARPLIEHFGLKRQAQEAYAVYSGDRIQLIVAGVGQLNAATACGYLAGRSNRPAAWLNIGIAGHKTAPLGKLYLAHKITRQQDAQSWYPAFTFRPAITTASLTSYTEAVADYSEDVLHDMEAAGFYQAASRFSSIEFIHCLKVVSDNSQHSNRQIDKQQVTELIASQLPSIEDFIRALRAQFEHWMAITATPVLYGELLQHWHFSSYQQHQLQQLVRRWSTCHAGEELSAADLKHLKNSREVIKYLEATLNIETGV